MHLGGGIAMIPNSEQLLEIVNANDCLVLVIRGHQAVERALESAISEALAEPHGLEIEKLSFALKVDIAVALRVLRPESRGAFLALNRVRNRFAHRSDAAFEAKDAEDFANTLSSWQRHVLGKVVRAIHTRDRDDDQHPVRVVRVQHL